MKRGRWRRKEEEIGRWGGKEENERREEKRGKERRGGREGGRYNDSSYYIIIQPCPHNLAPSHPHTLTHTCLGEFGGAG